MGNDRTLRISSCLDCPNHRIERDPSSHDSFDWMDDALVCRVVAPPEGELASRIMHDEPPGRIIVGGSRDAEGEYTRAGARIPRWCPLPKVR